MNTQGQRTGYGGGFYEREEAVEYIDRNDSDDEYDEVCMGIDKCIYYLNIPVVWYEEEEISRTSHTRCRDCKSTISYGLIYYAMVFMSHQLHCGYPGGRLNYMYTCYHLGIMHYVGHTPYYILYTYIAFVIN